MSVDRGRSEAIGGVPGRRLLTQLRHRPADHGASEIIDVASRDLAIEDSKALIRAADWLEHIAGAMRPLTDLLVVQHHRGDPVVRGVQIEIGARKQHGLPELPHGKSDGLRIGLARWFSDHAFVVQSEIGAAP